METCTLETVNIYDAKTRLSQLVDKAASGEDVVVSRNGKPLVRITRLEGSRRRIKFGVLKGKLTASRDADAAPSGHTYFLVGCCGLTPVEACSPPHHRVCRRGLRVGSFHMGGGHQGGPREDSRGPARVDSSHRGQRVRGTSHKRAA